MSTLNKGGRDLHLSIDHFRTGLLLISARTGVQASLAVCRADLKQQTLLVTIGQFLGVITKQNVVAC